MSGRYGEDLAHTHDAGFGALAAAAGSRVARELRRIGVDGGLVVEVGCGTGVTAVRLLDAGHDVLGIDPSPAMLAIARRRAPRATFRRGSLASARLPRCDAVIAVGEVVNYAAAEGGRHAVASFLARAAGALPRGGLLVLDTAGPGRVPGGRPARSWAQGADWAILVETEEDAGAGLLTRRMTTFRRAGAGWRRALASHRQLLLGATEVAEMLRGAGFRARIVRGYAGEPFARGHRVLIAHRRPA